MISNHIQILHYPTFYYKIPLMISGVLFLMILCVKFYLDTKIIHHNVQEKDTMIFCEYDNHKRLFIEEINTLTSFSYVVSGIILLYSFVQNRVQFIHLLEENSTHDSKKIVYLFIKSLVLPLLLPYREREWIQHSPTLISRNEQLFQTFSQSFQTQVRPIKPYIQLHQPLVVVSTAFAHIGLGIASGYRHGFAIPPSSQWDMTFVYLNTLLMPLNLIYIWIQIQSYRNHFDAYYIPLTFGYIGTFITMIYGFYHMNYSNSVEFISLSIFVNISIYLLCNSLITYKKFGAYNLGIGLLCITIGYICWKLEFGLFDYTICNPHSIFQLHGLWHIFTAIGLNFSYRSLLGFLHPESEKFRNQYLDGHLQLSNRDVRRLNEFI